MDLGIQLATLGFTGLLAVERGAAHCGFFSAHGLKHVNFSICARCLDFSLSRNASGAWGSEQGGVPHHVKRYLAEGAVTAAPSEVGMERRPSSPALGERTEEGGVVGSGTGQGEGWARRGSVQEG